jgi:hypothetical protein
VSGAIQVYNRGDRDFDPRVSTYEAPGLMMVCMLSLRIAIAAAENAKNTIAGAAMV